MRVERKKKPASVLLTFFFFLNVLAILHAACGILAPRPGIESKPPAVEVQSLKPYTTREVPVLLTLGSSVPQTTRLVAGAQ